MDRWFALFALLAACRTPAPSPAPPESAPDSAGGTHDARLAELCRDAWEFHLASDPLQATYAGEQRFDGELLPPSPDQERARRSGMHTLLARLETLDRRALDEGERLTWDVLHEHWTTQYEALSQRVDEASWNLDPRSGPQVDLLSIAAVQPASTPEQRERLLARWRKMPAYIAQCRTNLERGLASGRVACAAEVARVLASVGELLETPVEHSPLYEPALRRGNDGPDLARWRDELAATIRERIYPAFERYRDTLRDRVAPAARPDDKPGILFVDGGVEAYAAAIRRHTSLALTAQEIHDYGLTEVARIRAEIAALGAKVFGTSDVAALGARLRSDPALHFRTRAEVEAQAALALAKASAALPAAFSVLPRQRCEVLRVPEHEERDTTIGYYREPAGDGSRPGRYYVNTREPATRPRYDAEVLAFHEAVPGHHLQLALAQEQLALPRIRRHIGANAFVEGWALYAERLCDELGLYSGDTDRLGMLSFDAWRASRLVVDTGLHAFGWTRAQALAYLRDNTLLAESNVLNEVDRYIAWPGQALGYKLGQRELLALRAQARERLGARFVLADFHERVLANGALPLPLLRERIEAWLKADERANAPKMR